MKLIKLNESTQLLVTALVSDANAIDAYGCTLEELAAIVKVTPSLNAIIDVSEVLT